MAIGKKRAPRASPPKKSVFLAGGGTMNTYEAKTQFSRLLDRAAHGEEIVIARDGKPIACLGPLLRNTFVEILGRDVGKIRVPEDFNDPVEWTDEERAAFGL